MTISAFTGPLVAFGQAATGDSNSERGPSIFDQGIALADPRASFAYKLGSAVGTAVCGWLNNAMVIDVVPSALSATNLVTSQTPTAGTALTLTAGTGVTGSTSVINLTTGLTVTGLLALDGAAGRVSFGTSASVQLWDPTKLLARNVRVTSVGNDSSAAFTVAGYDIYGAPMTEAITGANAGIASGKKAFKYIASITPSGTLSGSAVTVGTGDVFGFPLRSDFFSEVTVYWNSALITANTGYLAAVTTSPATTTTGDVRGTYAVQSVSDATKRLAIIVRPSVANISSTTGLLGVTQV